MNFPIVPSARAAWIAAAAAPIALLAAATTPDAWIAAPAAAAALLVLVLLDGFLAGRLVEVWVDAPADTEIANPALIQVAAVIGGGGHRATAALACDPRLSAGGRIEIPLVRGDTGWRGSAQPVPARRGTAAITRLWLRWRGPLGLGCRQIEQDINREIRIWPDLSPVRSPAMQTVLRDAQFGLIARRMRGEGTQFEALSEYQPGMDRRRIDWKASARHTRLYARENESERNNQIVFAFDCGQAMCEPVDGIPRIDRAVSAALTASYAALKGGDRVALFGFAARPEMATPFIANAREFRQLQSAAASLDYRFEESNFTLALATLAARLKRRSLIVLFSDFHDPTGAELMVESVGRLVDKHLVLFVVMQDAELAEIRGAVPGDLRSLSMAVTADILSRQRAVVLQRLRQMGVDVVEAGHADVGSRLIDRYFRIKLSGAIG
ncbi:DUF58 domain-containing protein [Altererythrobacter aquiaggeris]|uniref:DUF58 domain-containing protein n=1 Tax=Aestuarierythrobacter aquiaggeris TaxID=1898396 RepID=UPI00301B52BA